MRVTNWIANLLPRTRSGQTRRRVSAFTLPPAERLESRTLLAGVLGLSINSASETRLSFTSSPNSAATNGRTSFDGSANDGWKFSVSGGPKSINVSAIYAKYSVSYYDPHWTLDLYPAAGQDCCQKGAFAVDALMADPCNLLRQTFQQLRVNGRRIMAFHLICAHALDPDLVRMVDQYFGDIIRPQPRLKWR